MPYVPDGSLKVTGVGVLLWHIALQGLDTSEQTQVAEVLGSNVYTVEDDDQPAPPPSEDTPVKSLSHSASSDTLKEVRVIQ